MKRTLEELTEQHILDELSTGILRILEERISAIVLYGSVARGTNEADSDVDIALFVDGRLPAVTEDRLSEFITDMNLKYDTVFSVIDIETDMFMQWRDVLPFYRNIRDEGLILWTAA